MRTPSLHRGLKRPQTRNPRDLERETGLEPATPCLEGRHLHFHCLEAANHFEFSTSHRSTLYGRKHGSCQEFLGPPATACTSIVADEATVYRPGSMGTSTTRCFSPCLKPNSGCRSQCSQRALLAASTPRANSVDAPVPTDHSTAIRHPLYRPTGRVVCRPGCVGVPPPLGGAAGNSSVA